MESTQKRFGFPGLRKREILHLRSCFREEWAVFEPQNLADAAFGAGMIAAYLKVCNHCSGVVSNQWSPNQFKNQVVVHIFTPVKNSRSVKSFFEGDLSALNQPLPGAAPDRSRQNDHRHRQVDVSLSSCGLCLWLWDDPAVVLLCRTRDATVLQVPTQRTTKV